MTESRFLCCCGVDVWTKVIAWIQIVFAGLSGFILIVALIYLRVVSGEEKKEEEEEVDSPYNPEAKVYQILGFGMIVALIVVITISFIMGIVLLKGASERNPKYLRSWLVYAVVGCGVNIVLKLVTLNTSAVLGEILILCGGAAWSGFLIWIVYTFKREIQNEWDENGVAAKYEPYENTHLN